MNKTIEHAMQELKDKAVELGLDGYFDGLGETEMIVLGLYRWGKYLEANVDDIRGDMQDIE